MTTFLAILFPLFSFFQAHFHPKPAESPAIQRLQARLASLQNDSLVRHGLVAFSVRDAKSGISLLELNGDKSAAPASTLKLVTTATALSVLGENFTFETVLEYDGELKDGTLYGNLYIRGSGDPTLGSDRFEGYPALADLMKLWAQKVKEAGIRRINGAVVANASLFEENALPGTWIWGDIGNYYGAAAYGLNINENLYRVLFQPAKTVGAPAQVLRTEPLVPGLEFANLVTTGAAGSGDQCYIYGAPYQSMQYLEGTIPAGANTFPVRGSLPDPPFFCAFSLYHQLRASTISVSQAPTTDRLLHQKGLLLSAKRKVIYIHRSPPLKAIAEKTNFMSLNLYAEALLKTVGRYLAPVQMGTSATTASGTATVAAYWQKKGIDTDGFWMKDGSGLSPKNTITATQLTQILFTAAREPTFPAFYASIPVVGFSGTVKGLAKGSKAVNNVRAKSGTTERVKSYAGYFTSPSGELRSFALLVNNYDSRGGRITRQMEDILAAMAEI
jgi:D-alanyl-D-alanine carboxypeptidase/D-alanyl-D-alanine-endopeptidase (penicillin-binding protein 4)